MTDDSRRESRSKVVLFNPKAKTEEFIRSAHNDFANSKELKERGFSGWRENHLAMQYELWLGGEITDIVSFDAAGRDPSILERVHRERFALD